jgi:hypothetical protein
MRNSPARHSDVELRQDAAHRLILREAEIVEAQSPRDHSWRILDPFQPLKRCKVTAAVSAPVNLQMTETILADATLDDPATIA